MNKILLIILVTVVVVGCAAFYGGMKYQESTRQNFAKQNLGGQKLGVNAGGLRGGLKEQGNLVNGEIIAKDDKSITVKLRDGGSKIVFFSDSTEITKSAKGSASDFEIGKTVTISGKQNPDGSFTAETVQMRSNLQK